MMKSNWLQWSGKESQKFGLTFGHLQMNFDENVPMVLRVSGEEIIAYMILDTLRDSSQKKIPLLWLLICFTFCP